MRLLVKLNVVGCFDSLQEGHFILSAELSNSSMILRQLRTRNSLMGASFIKQLALLIDVANQVSSIPVILHLEKTNGELSSAR